MKIFKFLLVICLSCLISTHDLMPQNVKNQVINNCPDPFGIRLFITAGGNSIGNPGGLVFREATSLFDVSTTQKLGIKDNTLNSTEIPMAPSSTGFLWVCDGVKTASDFYNPYGRNISIQILNTNIPDLSNHQGEVGMVLVNGVTDAPKLTFTDMSNNEIWTDSVDYNKWCRYYMYKTPKLYEIKVTNTENDSLIDIFEVDLTAYGNKTLCLFTSGFLYPEKNQSGPEFGLFAATTDGSVIRFPSKIPKLPLTLLAEPLNKSIDIPVDGSLKWKTTAGAEYYHLQLSKGPDFNSTLIDMEKLTDTVLAYEKLERGMVYYWRVRPSAGALLSRWSQTWQFTTIPDLMPPALVSPENGSVDENLFITLKWDEAKLAEHYHVQFAKNSDFSSLIIDSNDITKNFLAVGNLEYSTKYYWRVSSVSIEKESQWSETWDFTTMDKAEELAAPRLFSPGDKKVDQPVNGTLYWYSVPEAETYHLQIAKDSNYQEIIEEDETILDTLYDYSDLQYETTYYWHVRAKSSFNISDWSGSRSFVTGDEVSVDENNKLSNGSVISPNPASDFLMIDTDGYSCDSFIRIFTIGGVQVYKSKLKDKIDISGLFPGMYIINIGPDHHKFIKI